MPSIEQNIKIWDKEYKWEHKGDEWSEPWGDTDALWQWVIFPRIYKYLYSRSILEIAPGYGRFTSYLKNYCKELSIVDLSESCIEYCKKRFREENNISYFVNDGKSLDFIQDNSIDFVFSFDSLVHVESDAIEEYIKQISKKLTKDGIAFIHHSNSSRFIAFNKFILAFKPVFFTWKSHWRARTVSAELFAEYAVRHNCGCISQELINWRSPYLIDCISTFTRKDSKYFRQNRVIKNYDFMDEAEIVSRISKLY